ncbi:MAG: ATP-binding protein [Geminicoccaceae bacterium]
MLRSRYQRVLVLAVSGAVALILSIVMVVVQVVDHVEQFSVENSAAAHLNIMADTQRFYSREIVTPATRNGITARRDFADHDHAIPNPATFMHGLTESLTAEHQDRSFRFFSRFPFYQRELSGPQDDFEREALAFLERDASVATFHRVEEIDGERMMRYALAIRMSESCAACHNTHPDSPKRDWLVGDLRGVHAVSQPVRFFSAGSVARGGSWFLVLCVITGLLVLAVTAAVVLLGWRQIDLKEANEDLRQSSVKQIALERDNAHNERKLAKERAEAEKLEILLASEQEKMQLQRRFVAMVSHEFRTPLAIIDGQAKFMLRRLGDATADVIEGRLVKITSNVERLVGLMESMLASARLEAGAVEFSPKGHDLRALVEEVCAHQDEISRSHKIITDLNALPNTHFSDPHLMRQVLVNLLSNAVKYSPDADHVRVIACERDDGYHIAVRDYGVGIPEDELPKLGTQFYRASTAAGITGTGIGLNLVRTFMEMHGGSLVIDSIEGEGTTFAIHIPRAIAHEAA